MPARDFSPRNRERQRLFQVQLPQRLARLCQRGERLQRESWDINAMALLAEESGRMADACRGVDADALADRLDALHESVAALLQPPRMPDRATAAGIAEHIATLSRHALPDSRESGVRMPPVVATPTHESGFPLQTVPPRDYWRRFDEASSADDVRAHAEPAFESADAVDRGDETAPVDAYRVLIVEDEPSQLLFAESVLRGAGMRTLAVADALAALEQLDRFEPELILMDLHMPDCDGIDLTALIRQRRRFAATPIVFLSVEQDPARQAEALRAGGDVFLAKPVRPRDLVAALGARIQLARELASGGHALLKAAPAEPAPRERLMQRVSECLAMEDAGTRAGGLMVFSVEPAAAQNAALLAEIGTFLVASAGPRHVVANDAGGRFLLFNPDCETSLLEAYALSLRDRIAGEPFAALAPGRRVLCDVGICPFVAGAHHADTMRAVAQAAIDSARVDGRSGVFIVRDVESAADAELVERIRFALEGAGFELLFQPIVSLHGDEQEQFQALLRLRDEDRLHTASEVIPAATGAGLIVAVDRWTLKSCVDLIVEHESANRAPRLFVSQSLDSVKDAQSVAWLAELLRESRIAASALSLELRARDAVDALAEIGRYAAAMKELGVSVTLSGIEAGADNEPLLRALPVDFIKVAPSYLRLEDLAIREELHALVELAHELGKCVIAPRVEDARAASALWSAGIDFIQGNFVQQADRELAFDFHASAP